MSTSRMGRMGLLDPPISIDGTAYSAYIKVFPSRETGEDYEGDIVSGIIEGIEDLGNDVFRIKCKREFVQFSYIYVPIGGQGGYDVVYYALVGGNIVNHEEPLRFYHPASGRAKRGSILSERCEVGDMLWIGDSGYYITACKAYGIAPTSVKYNMTENDKFISRLTLVFADYSLDLPDLVRNPDAVIVISDGGTGLFDDAGFYISDGSTFTRLTRKLFSNDEYNYPKDATLAQGEYWLHPETYDLIISSHETETELNLYWYVQNVNIFTPTPSQYVVIEDLDNKTGYGETVDIVGLTHYEREDFEIVYYIVKQENGYGTYSVDYAVGEAQVALIVVNDTPMSLRYKIPGGEWTEVDIDEFGFEASTVGIKIKKVKGLIEYFYQEAGEITWTKIGEIEMFPHIYTTAFGSLSLCTWGSNAVKAICGFEYQSFKMNKFGRISYTQSKQYTHVPYKDYVLPSTTEIESIVGDVYGDYTEGGHARNQYEIISSNTIRFFSETVPDSVLVTQKALIGPAPTGRGRPPRVLSTVINFATGTDEATADVNENIANWYDYVDIYAPYSQNFTVGQSFSIRRNAVMHPYSSIVIQYAIKNSKWEWVTIATSNIYYRSAEGVFLLKKSFVDANLLGKIVCARVDGLFSTHHANFDAQYLQQLMEALNCFDELYIGGGTLSGNTNATHGSIGSKSIVIQSMDCNGCTPIIASFMLGTTRRSNQSTYNSGWLKGLPDQLARTGLSLPLWYSNGTYLCESDTGFSGCTDDDCDELLYCCESSTECYEKGLLGIDTRLIEVHPFAGVQGALVSSFGSGWPTEPNYIGLPASYNFTSIAFDIPDAVKRLLGNCEILEATIEAKFTGLEVYDWNFNLNMKYYRDPAGVWPSNPQDNMYFKCVVNGKTVAYINNENGVPIDTETIYAAEAKTSGNMTFMLIGVRKDQRNIFYELAYENQVANEEAINGGPLTPEEYAQLREDHTEAIPNNRFRSFGSVTSEGGELEDDVFRVINVTSAINSLLKSGRSSKYVDFQLYPTRAGITLNSDLSTMANYLKSIEWQGTISSSVIDSNWLRLNCSGDGQIVSWDTMYLRNLLIRFRLPSGAVKTLYVGPPVERPSLF